MIFRASRYAIDVRCYWLKRLAMLFAMATYTYNIERYIAALLRRWPLRYATCRDTHCRCYDASTPLRALNGACHAGWPH